MPTGNYEDWIPKPTLFYRKVNQVYAVRLTSDNYLESATWFGGSTNYTHNGDPILKLPITNGSLYAFFGDWIVRDERGRLSVYSHLEFKEIFEFDEEAYSENAKSKLPFIFDF